MDLKKINKQLLISIIIVVVGMFLGFNVVYLSALSKKETLQQRLAEEIKRVVLLKEINTLQQRVDGCEAHLSKVKDENILIRNISQVAAASNLKILSIQPPIVSDYGVYRKLTINVTALGTYAQFGSFVSKVENSDYVMTIDQFSMKADYIKDLMNEMRSGQNSNQFVPETVKPKVAFVISTYYLK